MKVNSKMVKYWLGAEWRDCGGIPKDVIEDFVDIANGKYDPTLLRQDILDTWRLNHGKA